MCKSFIPAAFLLLLGSCSVQRKMAQSAKADVLDHTALQAAHVGISIYDPAAGKYLYNYQGDKYFVPASNTKIPTCYAAMKYLGDSLVGLRYHEFNDDKSKPALLAIAGTADPSFLHPDFIRQPVFDFLKQQRISIVRTMPAWFTTPLGSGWAWNDYEEYYMAERSPMPLYGNLVRFKFDKNRISVIPGYFAKADSTGEPNELAAIRDNDLFGIKRDYQSNRFSVTPSKTSFRLTEIPFITDPMTIGMLLYDTLGISTGMLTKVADEKFKKIHSQPTDSLLKPMMHRSDNFFAEQSLLMVSNEKLGVMSDETIIDTLLQTDLKDLPQKPRWADGSGLSRYNLFTPQDLVMILNKMKNEFGMDRLKVIFPTGGEGTISSYYRNMSGSIFGKTGTLSGVVAFSGYLYTKKGKLLIFSTLVNNHRASATDVRRAVEKFLTGIWERY